MTDKKIKFTTDFGQPELQEYKDKPQINDVQIKSAKHFVVGDGTFSELVRLNDKGKIALDDLQMPVKQVNYSMMVPGTVKAWHVHQSQDEIWYPTPQSGPLIIGLMDIREESETKGNIMRIIAGGGQAKLIYIPRGVAHGVANPTNKQAGLVYLVSNHFSGEDEYRLPFDTQVGENFWQIQPG
jgi:dTDP-4-dehydrorhamnose 3,5-epimerase